MNRKQQLLSYLGLASVISAIAAQPAYSQIIEITDIQLNQTAAGLEILLQTADGQVPQIFTYSYGETLVADVITTQLRLSGSDRFRVENPAPGILSVEAIPLDPYSIRIVVVGTAGVPTAEVMSADSGLRFSVRVSETALQTPTPTPIPTPPSSTPDQPTLPTPDSSPTLETPPVTPIPPGDTLPTPPGRTPQTQPTPPTAQQTPDLAPIEIVVTATRTEQSVADVPRSVTVITREDLEQQGNVSRDLQEVLGTLTPGLGPPSELQSNFGQSLRGRRPLVLVDGVPISSNNATAFSRDLRSIDPGSVERVEVVRGPSAIYGDGASGGIINIITRRPSEERVSSTLELGLNGSLGDLNEDSIGNFGRYSLSGSEDNIDYVISFSRQYSGGFFDAEGDRIPLADSGLEDTESLDALGKLGFYFGENDNQRVQITFNHFRDNQDLNFFSDPAVEDIEGEQKARALERDLRFIGTPDPGNQNTVVALQYSHNDLFNSSVQVQAYFRDTSNYGSFFDERVFNPDTVIGVARNIQEQERWGGRLQIESPIASSFSLLWGVDYVNEDLAETLDIFDANAFDRSDSRVLRKTESRTFAPWHNVENLGIFAQGQWDISEQLTLNGGARYERVGVSVPDYTSSTGNDIEGGDRNFDATVFNVGLVYSPTQEISLFANFAQGFSVPTIARILYDPPAGFNFEDDVDLSEPQRVDNFEIGVRGFWSDIQFSLAAFYNTSDLGTTVIYTEPNRPGRLERAPQRNYGVEATLDWQPVENWQLGGIFSWTEGENDLDDDGEFLALDSSVVQPLKITAYLENQTTPGWRNRLQALYVGSRDRALDDAVDLVGIDSYLVFDYISSLQIGPGTLEIGVQNLFDNQYSTVTNQWLSGFGDSLNIAASGRTISVGYRLSW